MRCGRAIPVLLAAGLVLAGCGAVDADDQTDRTDPEVDRATSTEENGLDPDQADGTGGGDRGDASPDDPASTTAPTTTAEPSTTEDGPRELTGTVVSTEDGQPLGGAVVLAGDQRAVSDRDGVFTLAVEPDQALQVRLPTWLPVTVAEPRSGLTVELTPVVARGVRVSRYVAADRAMFVDLLDLVEDTTVNALVFDTKDETGTVLYETEVETAARLGAVDPVYRPEEYLALARERGLYPITRIVTFEDDVWADGDAEAKLAGDWVDAADRANWEYPIGLAEEACRLGFAEIQFDYVRFPAGRTAQAAAAAGLVPTTSDERSAVIAAFLTEARERLAPEGCGVSAAIFGIVMSSETDEGIGQTVEAIGPTVDALSPMLYPSHYGPGWLGFADPNDHPGPVIADALDDGTPRLSTPIQMRPWIQAFYYNGAQIGAQIDEAEARGAGWLLWNASGNYRTDWLPVAP